MPHIIETRPSTTNSVTMGIGIQNTSTSSLTPTKQSTKLDSDNELFVIEKDVSNLEITDSTMAQQRKQRKALIEDKFSKLPSGILQLIFALLPPFQMLSISELSRKFYNFVVLSEEMNEVWFRLVKHEEVEEKKRVAWYKQKLLEQEQRSVQMMRSFSGSSTCSNMSSGSNAEPISKQAQRQINKKIEAGGKSTSSVKVMKRTDRKKNWCKIYVDTILRGNGESPLLPLDQVVVGASKKPRTFQTIVLNETLADEHFRKYQGGSEEESKELSREAKTQLKLDKRMYYKSIRSKPKGKKSCVDPTSARLDKISPGWDCEESYEF